VRGMSLAPGDRVVGMEVLQHGQTLFTVTENGYGKRTSIDEYPIHRRGGKGRHHHQDQRAQRPGGQHYPGAGRRRPDAGDQHGKLIRMPVVRHIGDQPQHPGGALIDLASGERVVSAAGSG
jgi:DNA gyrase subunit A